MILPAGNDPFSISIVLALSFALLAAQPQGYAIWDRFFFNVELPVKAVSPEGKVKLLMYHRYPMALHNLKIKVHSKLNWIVAVAEPPAIEELEPTVIREMVVHFRCQPKAVKSIPDTTHITIEFEADELGRSKPIQLSIPLTKAGERQANEQLSIPIGEITVHIGGLERALYYASLLCAIGLVGFLIYRKHRLNRAW